MGVGRRQGTVTTGMMPVLLPNPTGMGWRRVPAKYSQFLRAQAVLRPLRAMTGIAPDGAEGEAVGWL
ncbi:hypothetical protein [Thermanaerothrix sp.]|uniref:hypothetical protein n=1 Tax=Thermanaerothrix sp. TaxID=2972675 RepID=UPI003C7EAE5C